jgi:phosphatidate cytidylyltransferase
MKLNNTLTRILVALIGIPVILAACYFGGFFFLFFVLGVGLLSFHEFAVMTGRKESYVNYFAGLFVVGFIIINGYIRFIEFEYLLLILMPLLLLMELFRDKDSAILNLGSTLLGIFYIGLFAFSLVQIREFYGESQLLYKQGGLLIISIMASIWACDSAAFFIGSAIGRHKLFPRVSPKKSWEGAIAGFIFSVAAMVAARAIFLDFLPLHHVVFIGLIVGVFGQTGDLIESLLKRDAGVKDSSNIIPGHGGIFDRFDSLLFTAPLIYLYLHFFVQ